MLTAGEWVLPKQCAQHLGCRRCDQPPESHTCSSSWGYLLFCKPFLVSSVCTDFSTIVLYMYSSPHYIHVGPSSLQVSTQKQSCLAKSRLRWRDRQIQYNLLTWGNKILSSKLGVHIIPEIWRRDVACAENCFWWPTNKTRLWVCCQCCILVCWPSLHDETFELCLSCCIWVWRADWRFICYSQPPLSVVGLTEQKAVVQAKNDILVYTSSFNPMKNTISG